GLPLGDRDPGAALDRGHDLVKRDLRGLERDLASQTKRIQLGRQIQVAIEHEQAGGSRLGVAVALDSHPAKHGLECSPALATPRAWVSVRGPNDRIARIAS